MTEYCKNLISKAFKVIPGSDYNRTLGEYLEETSDISTRQLFYEVVLPDENSWEYFRDKNYPSFARYMKNRAINPENPRGVIVAAFIRDQCYLLQGQDFVDLLAEMEGLDSSGLHSRIKQWLAE